MRRIGFWGILCFFVVLGAFAVPAKFMSYIVLQKDGTKLTLFLRGDEHFHYYETEDLVPVVQGEDNGYYYAKTDGSALTASEMLAHNAGERTVEEREYVQSNMQQLTAFVNDSRTVRHAEARRLAGTRGKTGPNEMVRGQRKGLVILVDFANLQMSTPNAQAEFDMQFNQTGYNKNKHIGSVHDYFYDQSYGQFDLTFDVVGPVQVSKDYAYYGKNDLISGSDVNPQAMVSEACTLVDKYVDFNDYDWDGDGEVEQVFVIYAGYGEASGAPSNTIWPHQFALYKDNLVLDGVRIYGYACTCELSGTSGTEMNGIGTACHEFSHCLGLPDFYNVNYSGGFEMDSWDVMSSGSYSGPNQNGEVPCGYTAYERWYMGWMELTALEDVARIDSMPSLADSAVAYKINNNGNPDEYIILENRQNKGWFSYVRTYTDCHGLLAYHVDYSAAAWERNNVNTNVSHQRMSVIPADTDYGRLYQNRYYPTEKDLMGDLFPGICGVTEFTSTSHAAFGGRWFNADFAGGYKIDQPITNIREKDGLISFDFMGGIYVPTPEVVEATDVTADAFTANWEEVPGVDYYTLEMKDISNQPPSSLLLSENFQVFTTEEGTDDGVLNLTIYIDSYTQTPGWSAGKTYTSQYGVKVGTAKGGWITTPAIVSERGTITVKCEMSANSDHEVMMALLSDADTLSVQTVTVTREKGTFVLTFNEVPSSNIKLCLYAETDFYVSSFAAYDGKYAESALSPSAIIGGMLNPHQTVVFDSLYTHLHRVENLEGRRYKYRVKAAFDGAFSKWSDYIEVELDNDSGISDTWDEPASGQKRIYDLNGTRVPAPKKGRCYIMYDKDSVAKKIIPQI